MSKKIIIVVGGIIVVVAGYYLISPVFRTVHVNEAAPAEVTLVSPSKAENIPVATSTKSFTLVGATAHPVSGTVRVITNDQGRILRFENFKTINGPDLHVYLSKDLFARDFIDLGKAKGTEGNINYEIPDNVDLSVYKYAMTWCKQFGVRFNSAYLSM